MFKAIGDAAYKAATKTGIAAGTEQPPYPCALPLRVINDPNNTEEIEALAAEIHHAARDLLGNDNKLRRQAIESGQVNRNETRKGGKKAKLVPWDPSSEWKPVGYDDPDPDGDCLLMSKPHIGSYNFAKANMTFRDCDPERILDTMHGDNFETRKKFSADLSRFEILARPTPTTNIQYHEYYAPPPVSSRHLIYLFEKLYVPEEDTHLVYGCSIDYPTYKGVGKRTVRAVCLWCWELTQVGNDTLATYASCMSPNGWAPTFVVGWMKNEIGKELTSIRRVMYQQEHGKDGLKPVGSSSSHASKNGTVGVIPMDNSTKPVSHNIVHNVNPTSVTNAGAYGVRRNLTDELYGGGSYSRGESLDVMQFEDERPQQEEELAWRELEENEELLLF